MKEIFVIVRGGVAYPVENSIPADCTLEIIDLDNIAAGDKFQSLDAMKYCRTNNIW